MIKKSKKIKPIHVALAILIASAAFILSKISFAVLTANETSTIYIESTEYSNNVPGSWKLTKNGTWIDKGTTEITYSLDTIEKTEKNKDVIFVLDTSNSMEGSKLDKLKTSSTELINKLLEDQNNTAALISFSTESTIVSEFTNDKEAMLNYINNLNVSGKNTDYYKALLDVEKLLKNYTQKNTHDLVVLFLTDGYPKASNQAAQYKLLKEKYPFITINGVQYEFGLSSTIKEIESISDNQFIADSTNLNSVLIKAVYMPKKYESFVINDYINTDNFYVESINNNSNSIGEIKLDEEKQIITINFSNTLYSGDKDVTMTVTLKLKDNLLEQKGSYETNEAISIKYNLEEDSISTIETTETLKLKNYRTVKYETNTPTGCTNVIEEKDYFVFTKATMPDYEPTCSGYSFKGWELEDSYVTTINSSSFIMPNYDITVRGTWTKNNIDKSMNGSVNEKLTLYKLMQNEAESNSGLAALYTGLDSDKYENNVYYYTGNMTKNNVLFGGFCWKMIRTTETGGVKIIYNGLPDSNGSCNNTGTATQIGTSSFNSNYNSPAYVGYMYNTVYTSNAKSFTNTKNIYQSISTSKTSEYYYADSYEYNGSQYVLKNTDGSTVQKYLWSDSYNSLRGYYRCSTGTATSCTTLYYIAGTATSFTYTLSLTSGKTLADVNTNIVLGKGYTENSDGTFTLTNTATLKQTNWYKNYSNYKGYYVCSSLNATTCSKIFYIYSTLNYRFHYISSTNEYLYGNSFEYDETTNQYTLTNTQSIWNTATNLKNNNTHYTCFNATGVCSTLNYVYYSNGLTAYYISLTNGKMVEDALNEMLWDDNVNKTDSAIKSTIDTWYKNNMTSYTDYLEDTIYCNDRSISSLGGWDANRNVTSSYLNFYSYSTKDLTCENKNDQFTVSESNGNGKLTYPVGLLTAGESSLIGTTIGRTDAYYWLGSPYYFGYVNARSFFVNSYGNLIYDGVDVSRGVRPVVSLRPGIEYINGDGSTDNPYIIDVTS